MNEEDIKKHDNLIKEIKYKLATLNTQLNLLRIEDEPEVAKEDLKEVKIEDLESINKAFFEIFKILFGSKNTEFNKHRVYRMFDKAIKDYDKLLLKLVIKLYIGDTMDKNKIDTFLDSDEDVLPAVGVRTLMGEVNEELELNKSNLSNIKDEIIELRKSITDGTNTYKVWVKLGDIIERIETML